MIYRVLVMAMAGMLAGCGGSGNAPQTTQTTQTPKEQITALETSGALPKLDRSGTTAGTDINSNGVRDDVDAYIQSTYTDPQQRSAALQLAKGIQASLLVDVTSADAVKKMTIQLSRATHCAYARFNGSGSKQPATVIDELQALSTNTKQRLLAHLAYNKAMDGTSWAMPEGDSCE